jgi:electron transport complex protein RnfB
VSAAAPDPAARRALADALDDSLPQTQCTRCGYPDCRSYAEAIAAGEAGINRCPPGGAEGVARLAALAGRAALPLDPDCGAEGPRRLAAIDEDWCIGCTLCLDACPVDCIVGGPKRMHTVIDALCTGCELCIPACPVDCIALVGADSGDATGWNAWSPAQAAVARERHDWHRERQARARHERNERLSLLGGGAAGGRGDNAAP